MASYVYWSLQGLISALTQGDEGGHLLGSPAQPCCGEELCEQASLASAGSARGVWAALGLPRSRRVRFPVYTAQAPGCSAGDGLKQALGCVHSPGLSRSGSGSRGLHKGADSVGRAFCALPRSAQLRDQVLVELTVPGGPCVSSPPWSQPLGFPDAP